MKIRRAHKADVPAAADLIVRTKRLNSEFDPLFVVAKNAKSSSERYASATLEAKDRFLLVAVEGTKVVGVIRAELRARIFYEPGMEGLITDFYMLPEFRRRALGAKMLERASTELKKMGAQIIVAEFPSRNEIAASFYTKRGFRSIVQLFAKNP